MKELTSKRLKELAFYNKETGEFFRRLQNGELKAKPSGSKSKNGYLILTIDCKSYYAHRLAWLYCHGSFPSKHIDHINGNRVDNRIDNLRDVSRALNNQNLFAAKKNNSTKTLGVSKTKRKTPYRARIFRDGKEIYLGAFDSIENAKMAYIEAKKIHDLI